MYEGPKSLKTKTINKLLIFLTGKRLNLREDIQIECLNTVACLYGRLEFLDKYLKIVMQFMYEGSRFLMTKKSNKFFFYW